MVQGQVNSEILDGMEDFTFESRIPEDSFGTGDCAICLNAFEHGQRLLVIPSCRHVYHTDCIRPVMLRRSTCPMCRRQISLEDPAGRNENESDSVV
ncbi:hypothetical protein AQUCO_00500488v1 [Aquilegia coerulea]|uniref:RING-type domain-containing protein n=1 Tax=Aquilegia coerulea TaxID=218851 RepID=A0A2G5ES70_AQUCA|nr:hypothetical protein AQUCO_00500488v1 [Aquilegia coerulea]